MPTLNLKKICEYFISNKLALHPNKTNFIIFSNKNIEIPINIYCNNNNENENDPTLIQSISQINEYDKIPASKFLGVYFDPALNFNYHINIIRNKLSKALFSLRLAKNTLNESSLILLYYSLFHCHLIYALPIWSSTSQGQINKIFKLQKTAIRIISNSKYNAHTEPLFKKFDILPLPDLVSFVGLQFMHRFVHNHLPISFANMWTYVRDRNPMNPILLCNSNDIIIPFNRLTSMNNFPFTAFPKLWQDFPKPDIKNIQSKLQFDLQLKQYFIDKLSSTVNCNRLFCPTCYAR